MERKQNQNRDDKYPQMRQSIKLKSVISYINVSGLETLLNRHKLSAFKDSYYIMFIKELKQEYRRKWKTKA